MEHSTQDLGQTLDALADALLRLRLDDVIAGEARLEALVPAFQEAARHALSMPRSIPDTAHLEAIQMALFRCRRLGGSVTQIAEDLLVSLGSSHTYTAAGSTRPAVPERPSLAARA